MFRSWWMPALALLLAGCSTSRFLDTQGIPYRLPTNAFRITEKGVGYDQVAPLKIEVEHLVVADTTQYYLDFETGDLTDDIFEVEFGKYGFFGKASLEGTNRVPEVSEAVLTFVLTALQAAGGVARFSDNTERIQLVYAESVDVKAKAKKAEAKALQAVIKAAKAELKTVEASLGLDTARRQLEGKKNLYTTLAALKAVSESTLVRLQKLAEEVAALEEEVATKEQDTTFVAATRALAKAEADKKKADADAKDLSAQAKLWRERSARLQLWKEELAKAALTMGESASIPPGVDALKALIEAYYAKLLAAKEPPTKETVLVKRVNADPAEDPFQRLTPEVMQDDEIHAVAILVREAAGFYGGDGVLHRGLATIVSDRKKAREAAEDARNNGTRGRMYYVIFED